MNRNEDNTNRKIPENDPSKAMDSKREVANSPDEKINQDFPGYPHYPASEDIMEKSTGSHRVDAEVENMGTGPNASGVGARFQDGRDTGMQQNNTAEGEGNDTAMTGTDGNNDEMGVPQNVSNADLNSGNTIPGTNTEEAAEKGSTNP